MRLYATGVFNPPESERFNDLRSEVVLLAPYLVNPGGYLFGDGQEAGQPVSGTRSYKRLGLSTSSGICAGKFQCVIPIRNK